MSWLSETDTMMNLLSTFRFSASLQHSRMRIDETENGRVGVGLGGCG